MKPTQLIKVVYATIAAVLAAHPMHALAPVSNDVSNSRSNAITKAVQKCSPAIVGISVTEIREQTYVDPYGLWNDPFFGRFFQQEHYTRQYKVHGVGSGFLISSDGYIVTNDHVAGNASKIVVTLSGGKKYDAKIIGSDAVTDVALLKIEGSDFPHIKFADDDELQVGEWAIAFGNPFGLFDNNTKPTVTVGVISNIDINFTQADGNSRERVYKGMIQTDAAISSGNSGGPLVNALGEVVGINTVIYSTAQSNRGAGSIGIGFAIPIQRARVIIDKLKRGHKIDRDFWTGLRLQDVNEDVAAYFKLATSEGMLVTQVAGGSPGDEAGLEPGDVIVEIDGTKTRNMQDVNLSVLDGEVGSVLKLTVKRGASQKVIPLTLKKPVRARGGRN
jgi:serine protease Do